MVNLAFFYRCSAPNLRLFFDQLLFATAGIFLAKGEPGKRQ
jgi:hypothetical protein